MKRWLALIASIILQSCLGVVYAWSTYLPALKQEYGIHEGRAGLIFGVCIAAFTVSMIFGGILQQKYGPRRIGATGGLLFLAGYLTGSFSGGNFSLLLTGFGVLAGAGIGFGYVCPLATGVKWFPAHKGLVTGLTVAGFGLGAVFFAKASQLQLTQGVPVLQVLRGIGLVAGITVVLASCFLFVPENGRPGFLKNETEASLRKILKLQPFRALFIMIFCGTFGGLLIIGNLKPIGISIGLSAAQATFSIMLFAAGNAAGRVLWGLLYDQIGTGAIIGCMLLLAAGAGIMGLFDSTHAFYLSTVLIAVAFGGCFVLFAARVVDTFGAHRIGEIYPFVFLGYGIAGLIGPAIGGWMLHTSGSRVVATACVAALAIAGALVAKLYQAGEPRPLTVI
jgi:OFA family oxalate/formate antiporter-like MFS transporter